MASSLRGLAKCIARFHLGFAIFGCVAFPAARIRETHFAKSFERAKGSEEGRRREPQKNIGNLWQNKAAGVAGMRALSKSASETEMRALPIAKPKLAVLAQFSHGASCGARFPRGVLRRTRMANVTHGVRCAAGVFHVKHLYPQTNVSRETLSPCAIRSSETQQKIGR